MKTASPLRVHVHVQPNPAYIVLTLVAGLLIVYAVLKGGLAVVLIGVSASLMLVVLGYPVIVSTVCRVPAVVIDDKGIRFPLMGVRLGWVEVSHVKQVIHPHTAASPVLLVFASSGDAVLGQVHRWLRREARHNLVRYGTPLVISDLSLNKTISGIAKAIQDYQHNTP